MDRRKALVASTIVTVTLVAGAAAFAANSGLVGGRSDNVGNLKPAAATTVPAAPTVITVYVDPATGSVVPAPAPAADATASAAPTRPSGEHEDRDHEEEEEEGDD